MQICNADFAEKQKIHNLYCLTSYIEGPSSDVRLDNGLREQSVQRSETPKRPSVEVEAEEEGGKV